MQLLMPGKELSINAIDEEEDDHGGVWHHEHTTTLTSQVVLKLDMLFEIYAWNYGS
jgi:hypothetical protein